MKILHISNYFSPHIGGIEQVAKDCIDALGAHEQKLICFNHEKGTRTDIYQGVEIIRVGCQAKISSQSIALGYRKQLKYLMNNFKPDVVIFHYPNPFVARYLLRYKKRKFKFVLYWHLDIFKQKFLKKFFVGQNNALCKRADAIVATSPNYIEKSEYLQNNRTKCKVIPNCVRTDKFIIDDCIREKANRIKEKSNGKKILFAIGRHIPYKGMEYLVRASKFLDDNYVIYIGGKGPLTESLKELAKDDSKIIFTGRIPDNDLVAYMLACDVFCFPSITKNEAFGIALAEAMYMGKPSVTFTIEGSGVNYVSLNNVTGLEVENSDAQKFAESIKTLCDNDEMRVKFGKMAKLRVEENFSYEIVGKMLNELINSLSSEYLGENQK